MTFLLFPLFLRDFLLPGEEADAEEGWCRCGPEKRKGFVWREDADADDTGDDDGPGDVDVGDGKEGRNEDDVGDDGDGDPPPLGLDKTNLVGRWDWMCFAAAALAPIPILPSFRDSK